MASTLTWSALLLAALAAVAWWSPEGEPACTEGRPIFGERACCRGHKVAGLAALAWMAELEAARRGRESPADLPWTGRLSLPARP